MAPETDQKNSFKLKVHPLAKPFYQNLDFLEYKIEKRTTKIIDRQQMGSQADNHSPKRKSRLCILSQEFDGNSTRLSFVESPSP